MKNGEVVRRRRYERGRHGLKSAMKGDHAIEEK